MDDVDRASELIDEHNQASLRKQLKIAARIPKGVPGECEYCGYHSLRLVGGACAPCRDEQGLP